jgi:hypothetical protein
MNDKIKIGLAVAGIAIVAYSIGYHRAEKHIISEFGGATAKEALIYLATQDAIRHKFGR